MFTQSSFDDSEGDDALSDDNISVYSNSSIISLSNHRTEAYKVITIDDVFCQMNDQIKNISDVMNIPATSARIVLDHFNWQSDRLTEKFVAAVSEQERDAFFRDAKILNPRFNDRRRHDNIVGDCLICFDKGRTTGLLCGHKFCRNCWNQYLTMKIVEYGAQRIACPDSKCTIIVEDGIVKGLISDPNVIQKYNRSICNNYVKFKANLSWCTSPGCNYVIDSIDCLTIFVTCKCGNQFCFECHEQSHSPISCQYLLKWKDDDSITQSYLSVNTKPCPSCKSSIEKNGGCPHMICFSCKHEFCWKCMVSWHRHAATYQCNTPDDDIRLRKTRTRLQRLNYCWDRYAYNRQTWKDEIDRFDFAWEQFEHRLSLKAALNHIFECRRFLMYSYAYVYYLKESNEVYILETNLDFIEGAVDAVSVLLENYIRLKENDVNFLSKEAPFRTEIINKTTHCDALRQKWLKNIEDGKASNTYLYRE
ncbi:E3 ubiquitin-protein ligase arih1-like isoform X2 [Bradysia coprophila]|uniref:E3 ubiquitin-protein ligase arih1-like isoform X2 n=1 Tax=Bradysia coprophila TaxID=38358 RepID=UPI00187DD556|nr:E3 ubiquitin-protein ligase arih1-like isoform X2 [Bradysia coprophila]